MDQGKLFLKTKNLSLLLVEDYEPLRRDMTELLEDLFLTVESASNGEEGLQLYKEYHATHNDKFDIVISDIQMPIMDGIELSNAVLKLNENQQIIILSSHTDSDYLLRLINLGIAQFIPKPITSEILFNVLERVSEKILKRGEVLERVARISLSEECFWDTEKLLLTQNNETIYLTRHELLLLQLFVSKSEQICTNEDMMYYFDTNRVDLNEKSVRNLVFKLRKKLPEKVISSIYGMGYKFCPLNSIDS
ncbi:MAG: DNA-binding response regulator [Epsilonproteobacteria bacterium]|nr:MAG: DNA-binding response regulator [Campylobacterota bacterium]